MKITLKIMSNLLAKVRRDLTRPHSFSHERVGFLLAGASECTGGMLLTIYDYLEVEDDDYERSYRVGAQIGSNAMRKAVQAAFRPQRTLLHVHTHGGIGKPSFSSTDLESAAEFIPGFLRPIPRMPHGLLVLSDDSSHGLCWIGADEKVEISNFISLGAPYRRDWKPYELAG